MAKRAVNVCMIGYRFMGRAHTNAYMKVGRFFDAPLQPVMHTVVGRNRQTLEEFAQQWGWQNTSTDWKKAVTDPAIDLVDVGTPNNQHRAMTVAALSAGKHVLCEKPLAATLSDARIMRDAARKARGCKAFVGYSYRRVPAIALAYQLVREGKIGRIYHVRTRYLQGWAGPEVPLVWRFDKNAAGSGSHGDLGAHLIDMARFITGQELTTINGAIQETFIKQRVIPGALAGTGIVAAAGGSGKKGKVSVDDATLFLAQLSGGGVASFEATRFAMGNENNHGIEINGEKGSLRFNFEEMSFLHFFDRTVPSRMQGWNKIQVSRAGDHPYADAWWPAGHHIGYEHTFINQTYDILMAIAGKKPVVPLADFDDAYETQRVLEAVEVSAKEKRPVKMKEIK
ncbi:MAG: Gfo/Idh/MocA family oxidoreductase [Phycisphaerales bacterium]|nr:Gfo/Idh/MocA family oxidoreductase [Phycisphaerales bacterium]